MLVARGDLARASGHVSYAHYACAHARIESDPAAVARALGTLSARLMPAAHTELRGLSEALGKGGGALHGWDVDYARALAERRAAAGAAAGVHAPCEYLELESALRGVSALLRDCFGLELAPARPAPGELWHPSVSKLLVRHVDADGGRHVDAGVLYLDLHARRGKSANAAVYTLRAAGSASRAAASAADAEWEAVRSGSAAGADAAALHLDLPAAALVASLPTPRGAGCDSATGAALLSVAQLQTIYHEIGHAMHALLGQPSFQHFSGVRVPLDFVEAPPAHASPRCATP